MKNFQSLIDKGMTYIRNQGNLNAGNKSKSGLPKAKYFFKEKYTSESDAFRKYYNAIVNNGYVLNIIKEVQNMQDYCNLFNDVPKDTSTECINVHYDPIPEADQNESILYASRYVDLIDSPEKGRCLVALSKISSESILIYEHPTVLQVNPTCSCVGHKDSVYRCHNCGTACKIFYTCDGCNICIFCSRTCMLFAYNNYHRYECYGLQRHFWSMDDTDYSYISLRMMLYGTTKKFDANLVVGSGYGSYKNNYPFIHTLESNFEQLPLPLVNRVLYSSARNLVYLIHKTNFFKQFKESKCQIEDLHLLVGGLMVKHYCQAQTNNVLLKFPNLAAGFGINVISGTGKAICPTVALLNHSCCPNAVVMMCNKTVVVKSLRTIKKGEEITICYREVDALLAVWERRIITEEIFNFICNCYFCKYERTWAESPYKCPICETGKAQKFDYGKDKSKGYCTKCKEYFSLDDIIKNLKLANDHLTAYKKSYSVEDVEKLADCYKKVFYENSWKMLDVYRLLYEKNMQWDESPLKAIKYGVLMFNILQHYISRLYLPLLVTKINFVIRVLNMETFLKLKDIPEDDFIYLRNFVEETMKLRGDLQFYLPDERVQFVHQLSGTAYAVLQTIRHTLYGDSFG